MTKIIIHSSFGVPWSRDSSYPKQKLIDPFIIKMIEDCYDKDEFVKYVYETYPNDYIPEYMYEELEIIEIPKNKPFFISVYDGRESVVFVEDVAMEFNENGDLV